MALLHRYPGCWCGGKHSFTDIVLSGFQQQRDVEEARILGPYEEDFASEGENSPGMV